MQRTLDNGAAMWALAVGMALGLDAVLVRTGHPLLSHHARKHPYLTVSAIGYFVWHLWA